LKALQILQLNIFTRNWWDNKFRLRPAGANYLLPCDQADPTVP
jgi:hypothetical protein